MNWYNITKKYNNIEYKNGSWDIDKGLDCFTLIMLFMEDIGRDITKFKEMTFKYEGKNITSFNYHELLGDSVERNKVFKSFILDNFTKTDKLEKGNIVLYNIKGSDVVGIYMGSSLVLVAFEDVGIRNIKINTKLIVEVYK